VTVLKGIVVDDVTRLKQELAGDIVAYASYQPWSARKSPHWRSAQPEPLTSTVVGFPRSSV
jgi:hypothetical protein